MEIVRLICLGRISGIQTPTSGEDTGMEQSDFTIDRHSAHHASQLSQDGFDDGSFQNCAWMFSDSSLNDLYSIPFLHPSTSISDF